MMHAKLLLLIIAFLTTGWFTGPTLLLAGNYQQEDCIECHKKGSTKSRLTIDVDGYLTSVHASGFYCTDCHKNVTSDYHISDIGSGAVNCQSCHQQLRQHGGDSLSVNRPSCQQCHTRHLIFDPRNPASSLHISKLSETCGQCHPEESGQQSLLSWLPSVRIESHNKQDLAADFSEQNCLGCHQGRAAHGEENVIDHSGCNDCHMTSAGKSALLGPMHPKADIVEQPVVYAASLFYGFLVVVLVIFGIRFWVRKIGE
jgi:hypothetical protein